MKFGKIQQTMMELHTSRCLTLDILGERTERGLNYLGRHLLSKRVSTNSSPCTLVQADQDHLFREHGHSLCVQSSVNCAKLNISRQNFLAISDPMTNIVEQVTKYYMHLGKLNQVG